MKGRVVYLSVDQMEALRMWGRELFSMFRKMPYLVGSVMERADWRDVDVRVMLPDDVYDALPMKPHYLNLALTLWGQKATGLPIDCQVQRHTDANDEFGGKRNAIGMDDDIIHPWFKEEDDD